MQVMKGMLDRLEREERQEQKRQRKAESVEERQKRVAATKSQALLYKHKETLKKDMMKKRALMEKAITTEIQVDSIKEILCPVVFQSTECKIMRVLDWQAHSQCLSWCLDVGNYV